MGAALIDNPGVIAMIRHHRHLYEDLRDPVAVLRGAVTTSLGEFWPYAKGEVSDSGAVDYSALMEASQALVASEVLDAYSPRRHRMLLDVGGGSGAFVAAAAARAPWLRVALFDLPEVAAIARERLGSTASVFEGSFRTDPLPAGADLITLVRILHDHDDDVAFGLLCEIRRALAPGGRLLIAEPMAGTRGALAAGEGYFGFYLMAMGSGRPRSPKVIRAMLRAAGFTRTRLVGTRTPLLARVIVAA
jgi:demethylspheroidene O-methyltransferase